MALTHVHVRFIGLSFKPQRFRNNTSVASTTKSLEMSKQSYFNVKYFWMHHVIQAELTLLVATIHKRCHPHCATKAPYCMQFVGDFSIPI